MVSLIELNGKKVVTTDAFDIGEVAGVELDLVKATILYLKVDLSKQAAKEFGFKVPYMGSVVICIPWNYTQAYGHVVNLNVPLSQLKTLKECS